MSGLAALLLTLGLSDQFAESPLRCLSTTSVRAREARSKAKAKKVVRQRIKCCNASVRRAETKENISKPAVGPDRLKVKGRDSAKTNPTAVETTPRS